MKTATQDLLTAVLSENQQKAIALKQFNREKFFIVNDPETNEKTIFDGDITEHESSWKSANIEAPDSAESFFNYCIVNCTEIEPIIDDEERDGYIVLTDSEADKKAKDYILETAWAFNASFLSGETGIDEEVFTAIQSNDRCESNNKAILSMISDKDKFVGHAIASDGRGHFITSYDGEENEETIGENMYFIYRMN